MKGHISQHAAKYAANFHVVKLYPGTNRPFEKGWQLPGNRLTPFQAEQAWARWPAMNLGVVAWPNYWVLDLDGPEAVAYFETLAGRRCGDVSMVINTPGRNGGRHLWWQMPALSGGQRLRSSMRGYAQAEIKHGPGHQTAMPPSSRVDGRYDFERGGIESPQPTPAWLMEHIVREGPPEGLGTLSGLASLAREDSDWGRAAGLALKAEVDTICRTVATASTDRNNILHWGAHRLLDKGVGEDAFTQLAAAASLAGLADDEIASTIRSAKGGHR